MCQRKECGALLTPRVNDVPTPMANGKSANSSGTLEVLPRPFVRETATDAAAQRAAPQRG